MSVMNVVTTYTTTLHVDATVNAWHPEVMGAVSWRSDDFPTQDMADRFAAQFPKSAGVKVRPCIMMDGGRTWSASGQATLAPTATNAVNEAGVRRYRSVVRAAAKAGLEIDWTTPYGNSIPTREAFEARLV